MNQLEEPWKDIWAINLKNFFEKTNSFTKVTLRSQNSDLQLLQFDIQ